MAYRQQSSMQQHRGAPTSNKSIDTVKWFDNKKGDGFLNSPDPDAGDGYKTLIEGQTVENEQVTGQKGLQAAEVVSGG